MIDKPTIAYLEVCSDLIHKAALRKAGALDDSEQYAVVPLTVCLLVRVDAAGPLVVGSTVRVPAGAPRDKLAEVLRQSAEALLRVEGDGEGTHEFQVTGDGDLEPIGGKEKFDA